LAAGCRPDPLRELKRSLRYPRRNKLGVLREGKGRRGKERGKEREGEERTGGGKKGRAGGWCPPEDFFARRPWGQNVKYVNISV